MDGKGNAVVSKEFPVSFNFKAFDNISNTIDRVNSKLDGLKNATQGINNRFFIMQEGTKRIREGLQKAGSAMTNVGAKLSVGVTLPLVGLATKFAHAAMEAEETASKFESVFGNLSEAARNTAVGELTSKFDLATATAQEMLSTTGLLASDLGLTGQQSLDAAKKVTALSVQIAAFRNVQGGAEAVSQNLRAAMLGQTKALKAMGIVIDDNQIKEEARRLSQQGLRFQTVEQAKALATLSLIQKKTAKDQKDFGESAGAMENQLRVAQERFKELSATFGRLVQPAFAKLLSVVNDVQKWFLDLSPAGQKLAVMFAVVAAAVGPLLMGLGFFVGTVMPALITGAGAVAAVFGGITLPVLAVVAAIAALGAIGYAVLANWETVKQFFVELWDGPLFSALKFVAMITPIGLLAQGIMAAWEPLKAFFGGLFDFISAGVGFLIEAFKPLLLGIKGLAQLAIFGRGGKFGIDTPAASGSVAGGSTEMRDNARGIGESVAREVRSTNDSRVQVDFSNAPRGTRVSTQSYSGMPPTLNLGLAGAPL